MNPWQPLFDLGVQSFYAGDLDTGRWACECLLSLRDVPADIREITQTNQMLYAPLLSALVPSAFFRSILFPVPPVWSRYNPTIAVDGAGYRVIVRSSNFSLEVYPPENVSLDGDVYYRSTNYLVSLDADLSVREVHRIAVCLDLPDDHSNPLGIEDCRLFMWQDSWYAAATRHKCGRNGRSEMAMLRLHGASFRDLQLLSDPACPHDEKNWMPFILDRDLLFVYSCAPTIILRYRADGMEMVSSQPGPSIARYFRGGSQGVPVNDGFLFVIHETLHFEDGSRAYPHRFILIDPDCRIRRLSTPFFFLRRSREFCCGMARRGDHLVISFGYYNREAYIAHVALSDVLAALRPVYG